MARIFVIDTRLEAKGHYVFVDESGLENAVLNLALNARGAMANGGVLTVTSAVRRLGAETAVEGGDAAGLGIMSRSPWPITDAACPKRS